MKTIKIKIDDSAYNDLYAKSLVEGVSCPGPRPLGALPVSDCHRPGRLLRCPSNGGSEMKYRILGFIAGLITMIAAFAPKKLRRFLLRKVKSAMYLVFG